MNSMNFDKKTLLISGACGVTSRMLARALRYSQAFTHTRLIGMDICNNTYGLYEGLYERIYRVPAQGASEGYQSLVNQICQQESVDAAIIVPEPEVLYWTQNPMPVPTFLPPPGFSSQAINKTKLYERLKETDLVPRSITLSRQQILDGALENENHKLGTLPLWLRDSSEGSTSGKGAICIHDPREAIAWMMLNPKTPNFMVSEFLPGRNLACILLYDKGQLIKIGCYERLEYFMGRAVISGVSGNISVGRLINDSAAVSVSDEAIQRLCKMTGEVMQGVVTVDLKTDAVDRPLITEINLRQVAAASAFAAVPGANLTEAQAFATFGRFDLIGPKEVTFPPHNRIFRDIDGLPLYVEDFQPLALGQPYAVSRAQDEHKENL